MSGEQEVMVAEKQNVTPRRKIDPATMEKILLGGDLSNLTAGERLDYVVALCGDLGLNWKTRPFEYLLLDKKLVLYARKDCTDQLRKLNGIKLAITDRTIIEGISVVTAQATLPNGRTDESIGAVPLVKEGGEWKTDNQGNRNFKRDNTLVPVTPLERANALMKSETKAKRRVTLSISGLGILDESELDTLPDAVRVGIDEEPPKLTQGSHKAPIPQTLQDRIRSRADFNDVMAELKDQLMQLVGEDEGRNQFSEMLRIHGSTTIEGLKFQYAGQSVEIAADVAQRIGNIRDSLKKGNGNV